MKYGMRERLSGAVILLALAVIFLPMLFDDPVPRDERPQPMLSIEAPLEVERVEVDEPEPPARLAEATADPADREASERSGSQDAASEEDSRDAGAPVTDAPDEADEGQDAPAPTASSQESAVASSEPTSPAEAGATSQADPIAELARAAEAKRAAAGEWSVQAGSFGEPENAKRLEQQLEAKGFNAYRRPRGNDLTAVYVGPYASAEEGERARSELKAQANLQGLVVRMSP